MRDYACATMRGYFSAAVHACDHNEPNVYSQVGDECLYSPDAYLPSWRMAPVEFKL